MQLDLLGYLRRRQQGEDFERLRHQPDRHLLPGLSLLAASLHIADHFYGGLHGWHAKMAARKIRTSKPLSPGPKVGAPECSFGLLFPLPFSYRLIWAI